VAVAGESSKGISHLSLRHVGSGSAARVWLFFSTYRVLQSLGALILLHSKTISNNLCKINESI
jgi:hypothetical protein